MSECETCRGKGFLWFSDRKMPWVPESGFKDDFHWDRLFGLGVGPCPSCHLKDHERWQRFQKKSEAAYIASGGRGGRFHLTDEQRVEFERLKKEWGVEGPGTMEGT